MGFGRFFFLILFSLLLLFIVFEFALNVSGSKLEMYNSSANPLSCPSQSPISNL